MIKKTLTCAVVALGSLALPATAQAATSSITLTPVTLPVDSGGAPVIIPGVATPTTLVPEAATAPTTPIEATVSVATVNGSGCPAGTASIRMAPDRSQALVLFSDYTAVTGGDVSVVEARKNCQISLRVDVQEGYTYALSRVDYHLTGNLGAGVTGVAQMNHYFQGDGATATSQDTVTGPFRGGRQVTVRPTAPTWAPCDTDRNLNLNSSVRLSPTTATATLSMDALAGFEFVGRRCA